MAHRRARVFLAIVVLALSWPMPGRGQRGAAGNEWRAYRAEAGSSAYSALDLINRDNVKNLQVAWTWKFDNYGGAASETLATETTPLMVNGVLYTITSLGVLAAIDAGTGTTIWQYDPETYQSGRPTKPV